MNVEQLREYCLSKKAATESFPFDDKTLVFKVMNKIYALVGLERLPPSVNLKCDPERAVELREAYDGLILPGYHMNKKLWNTVRLEGLDDELIVELIDHSYDLVVAKLPKEDRMALQTLR